MINFILAPLCSINLQCYEGKPLFEFDRARMLRSGLVGFTLHGSLSHYYYQFCEVIIIVEIFFYCWLVGQSDVLFDFFMVYWNNVLLFPGTFPFPRLVGCSC